jgi:hypothetical protein
MKKINNLRVLRRLPKGLCGKRFRGNIKKVFVDINDAIIKL